MSNLDKVCAPTKTRERPEDLPLVGEWYWVMDPDDGQRWLGCVVRLGSNYVLLRGVIEDGAGEYVTRISYDALAASCTLCPDGPAVLRAAGARQKEQLRALTGDLEALMLRLGVAPGRALPEEGGGGEAAALALRGDEPIPAYRQALERAKAEEIPALYKQIRDTSERLGRLMHAETIPVEAVIADQREVRAGIDQRLLSLDLYAGLSEEAVQARAGEPAALGEPIHLLQRRCYVNDRQLKRAACR
ncbi:MAG: hypothetical protein WC683_01405 [bacterium]